MSGIIPYIQALELPQAPLRRGGPDDQEPPPAFDSVAQAIAVGSQMTEFSSNVPQAARPAISNGLLLGQLAADKATAGGGDPIAWFNAFNSVMMRIGWQSTLSELNQQTISDRNAAMHKAIIPIVTAIFGPQAAAGSIILSILNGIRSMDRDAPWITLFQRRSNKVSASNFGLSYVDAGEGGGATTEDRLFRAAGYSGPNRRCCSSSSCRRTRPMKSAQARMSIGPETISTHRRRPPGKLRRRSSSQYQEHRHLRLAGPGAPSRPIKGRNDARPEAGSFRKATSGSVASDSEGFHFPDADGHRALRPRWLFLPFRRRRPPRRAVISCRPPSPWRAR